MRAVYAREPAHGLWDEISPLLYRHWEEIAHFKDVPLNPDVQKYNVMEDLGVLRCYTARIDGVLVGYAVFMVNTNMHYGVVQALQDVLYLAPEHRGTRVGIGLIKFCSDALKAEGVQAEYQHVKAAHNFGPMLERMGYTLVDYIYVKRLN